MLACCGCMCGASQVGNIASNHQGLTPTHPHRRPASAALPAPVSYGSPGTGPQLTGAELSVPRGYIRRERVCDRPEIADKPRLQPANGPLGCGLTTFDCATRHALPHSWFVLQAAAACQSKGPRIARVSKLLYAHHRPHYKAKDSHCSALCRAAPMHQRRFPLLPLPRPPPPPAPPPPLGTTDAAGTAARLPEVGQLRRDGQARAGQPQLSADAVAGGLDGGAVLGFGGAVGSTFAQARQPQESAVSQYRLPDPDPAPSYILTQQASRTFSRFPPPA